MSTGIDFRENQIQICQGQAQESGLLVAHKILVTAQSPNSAIPLWIGLFGIWAGYGSKDFGLHGTWTWTRPCQETYVFFLKFVLSKATL